MEFILSQILGGIALMFVVISYFLHNKSFLLLFQIIGNLFYAGSFVLVNAYVGAAILVVATLRSITFFILEKRKFSKQILFSPIFAVLYIMATIVFWSGPIDLLPLTNGLIASFIYTLNNVQKIRYGIILPICCIFVYSILSGAYVSAAINVFEVASIIVSIIIYQSKSKQKTKEEHQQIEPAENKQ